jgi:hypothetical protein
VLVTLCDIYRTQLGNIDLSFLDKMVLDGSPRAPNCVSVDQNEARRFPSEVDKFLGVAAGGGQAQTNRAARHRSGGSKLGPMLEGPRPYLREAAAGGVRSATALAQTPATHQTDHNKHNTRPPEGHDEGAPEWLTDG